MSEVRAWVGLGANLGDRGAALARAVQALAAMPETRVANVSGLYASAPIDAGGPDFLNAVVELRTGLAPLALLDALQAIELAAGRERPYRNAPRTLDLDLLIYADQQLVSERLTLPHPRIGERAFVLLPLAEIAPERVASAQLKAVEDQRIERVEGPQWVGLLNGF
ncbi:2-amino-4-hydroxy-6-hydroxymethyldihydropteridine diphosphokinase [Acidovorax sp. CCYZU-2555]|uniref:2-amino-4-hydroxy-6- hydroxymethyldihydropteridine diphosphokinase n=1 Tax=Acidovorax sp. CCYZU-2555 TaxID=2835042 RepID=UPI001BCC1868|nr:2-amino-4-hydroxy-6-hydroxymethyldihydropteridine diphosphokinase [Acidovorax sp. CCYZU-2555]MBS7778445.1 2-amino-4-hydroxy-6-hydroxymethyldihydropteridine diphosphokinase [Acidovorax sp. CCYZU-2555]